MAARAVWHGVIRAGDLRLPVKLYAAVEERRPHFRLLHAADLEPVRQRLVHPETGEEVPREAVRRGYEIEPGTFVVLDDDELAAADPEPSREIRVTRFVQRGQLAPASYERPYWLGPDGRDDGTYAALAGVLTDQEREGIARWTMRKSDFAGSLQAQDGHLVLVTLRAPEEVIAVGELPAPAGRDFDARELRMAGQLVAALQSEFDPAEYEDTYSRRVAELIEAKAEGKPIKIRKLRPKRREASLTKALEASLKRARRRSA